MIRLSNLSVFFGKKNLFTDVSLNLSNGNRYGITGANGSGKSTLLKILAGEATPQEGEIGVPSSCRVGFLKQNHFDYEDERIIDTVLMGKPALWKALDEKHAILDKEEHTIDEGMKLAELEADIAAEDGYEAEAESGSILEGLGIESSLHNMPMSTLSGGYKLRVLLAQTLFARPGLLLMDEPTNHLDIASIGWLEGYLSSYAGTVVVVSHDHHFLNAASNYILDIDYETIRPYKGNYDEFIVAKELEFEQREKEAGRQEKKKDELRAFYTRFRGQATKARQAMSRKRELDKMDDIVVKRSSRIAPKFRFTQKRPSGRQPMNAEGICKSFGDKSVLKDVSFSISRGERLAVIGPNGVGKTTLLRILAETLKPDSGEVTPGHEVSIGYFAQNHREQIPAGSTPYKWLLTDAPAETSQAVRSTLGMMLFSGDDADKNTKALSGGEAARLVFSGLILRKANLMLLDEPTNHLDLETIEALSESLKKFPGTVIFVSHDRFFVERVATSVLELTHEGFELYMGRYSEFLKDKGTDHLERATGRRKGRGSNAASDSPEPQAALKSPPVKKDSTSPPPPEPGSAAERTLKKEFSKISKKIPRLEGKIKEMEDSIETINVELASGELYAKGREDECARRLSALTAAEAGLAASVAQWEAASVRLAELEEIFPKL